MTAIPVATCWSATPAGLERVVRTVAERLREAGREGPPGTEGLVEVRLDLLARPPDTRDLEAVVRAAAGRLLVTCRPPAGAGSTGAPAGEGDRLALLEAVVRQGALAVDVEAEATGAARLLAKLPAGVLRVVSSHLPAGTEPAEVERRAAAAAATGAELVKVAVPVTTAGDALTVAERVHRAVPAPARPIPVPTGPAGAFVRCLAGWSGPWTCGRPLAALAYLAGGPAVPGPDLGQPGLVEALADLRVHRVDASWRLFGIAGWPLAATWSPRLHGKLFARRGVAAVLVPLPVPDLGDLARLAAALPLAGLAITAPHKQAARELAAAAAPRVVACGAANTLRRGAAGPEGGFEAENFDGPAAVAALAAFCEPLAGRAVLVLGAGGAAAAVAAELAAGGARVAIAARRPGAARALAECLGVEALTLAAALGRRWLLVVNATSAGAAPAVDEVAIDPDRLQAALAMDVVTTPPETRFLRRLRARGVRCLDGLAMLAGQAAAQQAYWAPLLPAPAGDHPPPPAAAAAALVALREIVALAANRHA